MIPLGYTKICPPSEWLSQPLPLGKKLFWLIIIVNLTGFRIAMETHLCMCLVGIFPERFNWRGNTHLECGRHQWWVGVLDWVKEGNELTTILLSPLPVTTMWASALLSCYRDLSTIMDSTLKLWPQNYLFLPCFCQSFCHNNRKNNSREVIW